MSTSEDPVPNEDAAPDQGDLDVPDASVQLVAEACLAVMTGASAGRTLALTALETIIGRGSGAHIRVNEPSVSTQHAKLRRDGTRHVLIDLGSTNGTWLNGRRIDPNLPIHLSPGDNIQVAQTVLAYLPSKDRSPEEQTQFLSRAMVVNQSSSIVGYGGSRASPGTELLAQLLQATQPPPEPPRPTLEEQLEKLRAALLMVRRNWLTLVVGAALGALVGDASVFVSPPLSDATFTMRITPPANKDQVQMDPENNQFFSAAEQDFVSPALMRSTLVGLGTKFPSDTDITQTLKAIKLEPTAYMTYTATYRHRDPAYAVRFLQKHAGNYIEASVRNSIHVVQAEVEFLTTRLKEREAELTKTEAELTEFKKKHLEGLPEFSSGHVSSREALMQRRVEVAAQVSKSRLEFGEAQKRLATESPALSKKVGSAAPFEQALSEVERKLAEDRAKGFGDQHPEVVALKKQQADLKRMAEQARTSTASSLEQSANPTLIDLQRRVGSADVGARGAAAELGEINAAIARLDSILKASPEVEQTHSQLTRSYSTNKEMYTQLFGQLREAQLKLDLERTSARARYEVLIPPVSGGVALRKVLIERSLIGIAIGFVLAALVVVVREIRRFLASRRAPSVDVVQSTSQALARRS